MTEASAAPTDNELLDAARAGSADALEALLERHQAQVYRFGMKMCRDPEDAKDVLQDTLLAAARGVREFRGASSLSTWLFTIARSFCIKKRRRSVHAPAEHASLESDAAALQATDAGPIPDQALERKQVEEALEAAIDALEPMYREVLVLRDVEGLAAAEVAEVLGISVDAVKSRLHRARLSVRAHVAPRLGIPLTTVAAPRGGAGGCPDVLTLLSRHLEGEISPETCAEMEKHVDSCPSCTSACDSLRQTLALCRSAPSPQVPVPVQESVRAAIRRLLATKT